MSLSLALNSARSSLQSTAAQIAVSGRNVSGANDPNYTRKIALATTTADGAARIISVNRSTDLALFYKMLGTTSSAAGQQELLRGLDRLDETVGDPQLEHSPAARLGVLANALQQAANQPDDALFARAAVAAAQDLASSLNEATGIVQATRAEADADIEASVLRVNDLLAKFEMLNGNIVKGSFSGTDITEMLDQRDGIVAALSEEMGISVVTRANHDMVLYTDSGVTLFETRARTVTFQPTPVYTPATVGNPVLIDGVPVTGASATMPLHTGKLAGATALRDNVAVTYQAQLDEIARGLIASFAESDQSGGGGADAAGLFTYPGGPGLPATPTTGMAGAIRVNPAVDPTQGGQVALLRDGGMNGPAYAYNATGAASFSGRIEALVTGLAATATFDPATGLASSATIMAFASSSVSWLEGTRTGVSADVSYQTTLLARASEALSSATGVNMDEEYAQQLQLEQSYAASAKLINVIDKLFEALLGIVR